MTRLDHDANVARGSRDARSQWAVMAAAGGEPTQVADSIRSALEAMVNELTRIARTDTRRAGLRHAAVGVV